MNTAYDLEERLLEYSARVIRGWQRRRKKLRCAWTDGSALRATFTRLHFSICSGSDLWIHTGMRWRVIGMVSLGVNIALAAGWFATTRQEAAKLAAAAAASAQTPPTSTQTNIVLRRQLFSWKEVESPDYATYIANLRGIGCPDQTIHDLIIADVNATFARRRATELVTSEQQWWRSEPDSNVVRTAGMKLQEMEDERRDLLTRLLGPNWEGSDMVSLPRPSRPGVTLDGPVLGTLSADTKQALQQISLRSADRMQAYLDSQRNLGKEPDPVALAKLRQRTRDDLARLLSPPELEEFLLRYSQNATDLRATFGQLKYFKPTPDEFRTVFRATDTLDQKLDMLADATDPSSVQARKALESQRENAIKVALGPKRYEDYRLLQDPMYRDAVAAAEEAGTPDAAKKIYAINMAALEERNSIRGNTNLTTEQRNIELKRLELEQLQANALANGQELPPEPPTPPTTPPPKKFYVLGPGDSVATIALMYGLPVSAIKAANPRVDFNRLKPGEAIIIPKSPFTAPSP
jgi:LysM repeat protein